MAEQPEIETLRRDLDRDIGGKRIKTVEVPGSGAIPRHTNKKQFIGLLEGAKITSVVRRDLLLVARLDTGYALVLDIERGGGLRRQAAKEAVEKPTKVVITFTQGGQLRLLDTTGEAEDGQIRHQSGDPEGQAHASEQYSGQSSQSHVTPSAFLAASEAFLCIGPADPATLSDRTGRPAGASR